MRHYYFDRYHVTRILVTLVGMGILCIAAYALPRGAFGLVAVDIPAQKLSVMRVDIPFDIVRFIAYLLFLAVLFASEIVVARWRRALRDQLYDVRDELFVLTSHA